jgi:PAS domain S-box-containing protein
MPEIWNIMAVTSATDLADSLAAALNFGNPAKVVIASVSGTDARAAVFQQKPALLVIDLTSDPEPGIILARYLQPAEGAIPLPVVFLVSPSTPAAIRQQALEAGAAGFLTQPLDAAATVALFRSLFRFTALYRQHALETEELQQSYEDASNLLEEFKTENEARAAGEEKYRLLTESINDVVWVMDTSTGGFSYVSPSVTRLRGYTVEEIMALPLTAALTPESVQYLAKVVPQRAEDFQAGRISSSQAFVDLIDQPCKDGSIVHTEVVSTYFLNPETGHVNVRGVSRNITDRKRAEDALRKTSDYLESLITYANAPIIVWDPNFRITRFNRASEALSGRTAAEVLGKPLDMLFPPAQIEASMQLIKRTLTGERWETVEIPLQHRNGAVASVLWNSSTIFENNCPVATIAQGHDITIRKQAEERYRVLFQEMLDGFALHEIICNSAGQPIDYRFLSVNPAFERLTGLKAEAITGKRVLEILPQTEAHWIEKYGKVALTGEAAYFQNYSHALRKYFEVKAFRPAPGQFACIFADVTERVLNEKQLQSANAKLSALWNITSLGDADLKTISDHILASIGRLTDSAFGFYGFVNDDETTMTIHSWSGEAMAECAMAVKPATFAITEAGIWGEAVRRRAPLILNDYSSPHPAKKGLPAGHVALRNLMVVPFMPAGKITAVAAVANREADYGPEDVAQITAFLASIQAITDGKRKEEALRLSEERYRTVANFTYDWEYWLSPQREFLYCSPACARITGYTAEEFQKNPGLLFEIVHPEDRESMREYPDVTQKTGREFFEQEFRIVTKSGEVRWIAHACHLILNEAGESLGRRASNRDITERKRAEAEREQLQSQLFQAQKIESVGQLAGGVAHDFNNLLGVILGYAEVVLGELNPVSPLYGKVKEIEKAAQRSANLTRQLLAFARKQTVSPKALDLNETVEGTLKMLRRLIGEHITLTWAPKAQLWPVFIDPGQVDQILANLCVNARDAIPEIGHITIATDARSFDAAFCTRNPGFAPGEFVSLTVSDSGVGMEPDVLAHIFEPFYTTKAQGRGTGLGLATIYGIVKQNQGFIQVQSAPGRGSMFQVYLPHHTGPTAGPKAEVRPGTPHGKGQLILVVEDEPTLLDIAREVLEGLEYRVLAANTPSRALELAAAHSGEISLLITDVIMPEMNGRDLVIRIQQLAPGLKCLFISGHTGDIIATKGVLESDVQFLQKPFTIKSLAEKVKSLLGS